MEHELNHLCGLIERQHGVIESLAGFAGALGRQRIAVALDRDRLALPLERARPRMGPAAARHGEPGRPLVAPAGLGCFSLRHRGVQGARSAGGDSR